MFLINKGKYSTMELHLTFSMGVEIVVLLYQYLSLKIQVFPQKRFHSILTYLVLFLICESFT